jgi:flavocytochrome c
MSSRIGFDGDLEVLGRDDVASGERGMSRRSFVGSSAAALGAMGATAIVCPALAQAKSAGSSAADSAGENGPLFSNPGTYSATAPGRNGDVELEVEFTADSIASITVTSTKETLTIGGQAMDILTERALDGQTIELDNVSGATFSSNAFIKALKDCVEQAGGDQDALSVEIEADEPDYETDADVLVLGAGAAGLTAALTAAQEGAKVILLEKGDIVGGNTNAANSGINAAGSQVQIDAGLEGATVDYLVEVQMNNDLARPELVDAFAQATGEVVDWLTGLGVVFETSSDNPLQLSCTSDIARTGDSLVKALHDAILQDDRVSLYKGIAATSLATDPDGRVTGVVATDASGREVDFSAGAVIVATGGYGKNHDMVLQYRPDLANTITDEIAPTTGDGFVMATAVGAVPVDMGEINFHGHCVPGYSMMFTRDVPGGRTAPAGIYVNAEGERFADETSFPNDVYQPVLDQTDGAVFHVFPETFVTDVIKAMLATGFASKADTPEELAKDLGVDPDGLSQTVRAWNEDIASGGDEQFGRTDENAVALEGTLYGYEFHDAVHYFMGGVLINPSAQVVDENGDPIPGLYAAGEVTGGMQGTTRVDGTGLMDGFTFGRIAGKAAAVEVLA